MRAAAILLTFYLIAYLIAASFMTANDRPMDVSGIYIGAHTIPSAAHDMPAELTR